MRTILFSSAAKKRPGFAGYCRPGNGDVLVDNGKFGKVMHAVVVVDDDRPVYDFPLMWDRGGGGVVVPVTDAGEICFVRNFRPAVAPPDARAGEETPTDLSALGMVSLELPRRFADDAEGWDDTALREATEELDMAVSTPVRIGSINPNTSFTAHSAGVFMVRVGERLQTRWDRVDVSEPILGVRMLDDDEVWKAIAAQEVFCGFTLAALMLYFAWKKDKKPGVDDVSGALRR